MSFSSQIVSLCKSEYGCMNWGRCIYGVGRIDVYGNIGGQH